MPITGIAFCCARATSGNAAITPARRIMKSRRVMPGLSLWRRAGIMAQRDHFRYAGRMAANHPLEPFRAMSFNDRSGAKRVERGRPR
jgi:hypothetical protein